MVALSFMLLILAGAFLFMLPISTQDRQGLAFLDALFTATSASCVTGLTVIDVGNQLSWFGQNGADCADTIRRLALWTMTDAGNGLLPGVRSACVSVCFCRNL